MAPDTASTYGFDDLHCQKLYGRCAENIVCWTDENGMPASPPFTDGGGRWSRATLSSTSCMHIIITDWMSSAVSNLAPG